MPAMKPCPFCGEDDVFICKTDYKYNLGGKAYVVSCRTRECHGVSFQLGYGLFATKQKAIKAWNKRA